MFNKTVGFILSCLVHYVGMVCVVDTPAHAQITALSTEFDGDPGPWSPQDAASFNLESRPGWLQVTSTPNGFGSMNLVDLITGVSGLPVDVYPVPWHFEMKFERPTDVPTAIGFLSQSDGIQYLFNHFPDTVGDDGRNSFGFGATFPVTTKGIFGVPDFTGVDEEVMSGEALELWVGVVGSSTMRYGVRRADSGDDWAFAPDLKGFFDLEADPVSFALIKIMIENRQPWFDQWPGTIAPLENVVVDFDYIRFFVDAQLPKPPGGIEVTMAPGEAMIEWDVPDPAPGVEVTGYNVYRSLPAPFERLNAEPLTERSFVARDLLQGREYCFAVRSVGDAGFESPNSDSACDITPGGEVTSLSTEFNREMGLWEAEGSTETSLDSSPGLLEIRAPPGTLGVINLVGGVGLDRYPPPWHFEASLLRDTGRPTAVGVSMESDGIQYLFHNFPGGTGPDRAVSFGAGAATDASGKGVFGLPDFSGVPEFDLGGPAIELWVGAINNTTMRFGVRQAGSAAWRFAPDVVGFDLTTDPVSFGSMKIVVENRQQWYDQWPGTDVANRDAVVEMEYLRFFPETPAPRPPQFVSAAASERGVTLKWIVPAAMPGVGIIGYNVYQTLPGPTELLTFAPVGGTEFAAPAFEEGSEHCYVVRTVGDNGLESPNSNAACATTSIFGDIESLSTEFDGNAGPWASADSATIDLTAREGWMRITAPKGTFATIQLSGGLPVDTYEPEWHFEMRVERPADLNTAVGFLSQSDGIQSLFTYLPGATGVGAVFNGANWNPHGKGIFGMPNFSQVPESEMSGTGIEIWVGVIDSLTMRYGVRPAGADAWNFAPDLVGGFDLASEPVSFPSVKIMVENRQGFYNQFPDTYAPDESVAVDIDYIRFFEGSTGNPNAPQNVTAVAGGTDITLSWDAPAPVDGVTVAGYNVFRTTPAKIKLNTELVTDTQFLIDNLVGQRDYCFVVQAVGGNGFGSRDSEDVCETPTDEPPPLPPIMTGLVASWPFEDGRDCTGNGHDLGLSADVLLEPGLIEDALSIFVPEIAGPGPAFRVDDDAGFNFGDGDFTIHLWVNFSDLEGEQVLIEKLSGSGSSGWTLTKLADGQLLFFAAGEFGVHHAIAGFPVFIAGEWHQVVVRREDTIVQLFVDTQVVGESFEVVSAVASSSAGLIVGMRNKEDGRGFVTNGLIDEVAIWNRAIGDSDIDTLYGDGFGVESLCGECVPTEADGETSCEDGEDNDCDGTVDDEDSDCKEEEGVGPFVRGDCDNNGQVGGSPTEAIVLLNFSFRGGPAPGCLAACDAEANGSIGITDALRILRHSFLGQGEPDAPFPDCVRSALASDLQLGCETPVGCP